MRLAMLHLDNALNELPDFRNAALALGARELSAQDDGERLRLWGEPPHLRQFADRLRAFLPVGKPGDPVITFYGSGDFHHVTALLLECLTADITEDIEVFHFDNHPDWVYYSPGVHCGSWVHEALALPRVRRVITLGPCSTDLAFPEFKEANLAPMKSGRMEVYPYAHPPSFVVRQYGCGPGFRQKGNKIRWNTLENKDLETFIRGLLSSRSNTLTYVTIDKDVLGPHEAATNWDQGRFPLHDLLRCLRLIAEHTRLLGIDVTGDASPLRFAGSWWVRAKKHLNAWFEQPRSYVDLHRGREINARTNLQLLALFREMFP